MQVMFWKIQLDETVFAKSLIFNTTLHTKSKFFRIKCIKDVRFDIIIFDQLSKVDYNTGSHLMFKDIQFVEMTLLRNRLLVEFSFRQTYKHFYDICCTNVWLCTQEHRSFSYLEKKKKYSRVAANLHKQIWSIKRTTLLRSK